MNLEPVWRVAKWGLVVLAAGFVGQFGRHLARLILERRRSRSDRASIPELEGKRLKEQAKLEKKRAKAELKRVKKLED